MEVIVPSHGLDFDFNSSRSSPQTPRRFGEYYFSAPTSPSHVSQFYKEYDEFLLHGDDGGGPPSSVPFDWEEKPGTPKKSSRVGDDNGDDFVFAVGQDWETTSVSAEELFDGGVIKPLKPPPRLQLPTAERRMVPGAFSPRDRSKREKDTFAPPQRGRERSVPLSKQASRRAARSLSPLRDPQYMWVEEEKEPPRNGKSSSSSTAVCSAAPPSKGQKKWSFKDFFLFRSASEGRASDKDPLKKYTASFRRSSFHVIDSPVSGSKRRGPVSAHELHYTVNRAVSEDLKKKTFLPYKQGILGRLAFNPAVHALANGFGFSRKSN